MERQVTHEQTRQRPNALVEALAKIRDLLGLARLDVTLWAHHVGAAEAPHVAAVLAEVLDIPLASIVYKAPSPDCHWYAASAEHGGLTREVAVYLPPEDEGGRTA